MKSLYSLSLLLLSHALSCPAIPEAIFDNEALESPRKIVAAWLQCVKAGRTEDSWNLTTRSSNAGWSPDLTQLWEFDKIRPRHELGSAEAAMVVSNPFKDNTGETKVFYAILLKHNGQWRIDRHRRTGLKEATSLMAGFKFHPGVTFKVHEDELVGEWHSPCTSLTLIKGGTGIHAESMPGAPKKPESIKWKVNQSTLTMHWPCGDQTWEVVWVDEDSFQINYTPGKQEPHVWTWYRVKKEAPSSQSIQPIQPTQP